MLRGTERILTTHTGSLPRPEALTRIHADRGEGKPVEQATLDKAASEAVTAIIAKQSDAGVAIGNNGEQPRDSCFLYLRQRMSGFGGHWERPTRADVDRYPVFRKRFVGQPTTETRISGVWSVPMAIGPVKYTDPEAILAECRQFKAALEKQPRAFKQAFMSSPSPGIVSAALKNAWYDTLDSYLREGAGLASSRLFQN